MISGIGTNRGLYVHPEGVDADILAQKQEPLLWFSNEATRVKDVEAFIQTGKKAGSSLLLELTTLSPQSGYPAIMHIQTALQAEMDVITANKGPVAYAQAELQTLARQHRVQFRFESTVMDGLPLLNLAEFTLRSVEIVSFRALLNSTSCLVLNMIENGSSPAEAIRSAQRLGITETDPSYDLDGWDSVMKTTILANTLLEGQITPQMVKREGIRSLSLDDIRSAAMGGSPYRLLSQASRNRGLVSAEVRPCRIDAEDILHGGKSTSSVISLVTQAMGTITLVEQDPTAQQTAYGVLSDLITIVQQRRTLRPQYI